MQTYARRIGLVAVILGFALFSEGLLLGQAPDLAHYGTWRINLAKTEAANKTPSTRAATFTWIYAPEGDGIRHTIYTTYPKPAPDRSYFARLDGKEYGDPHGPSVERPQTVTLWPVNRFTIVREVKTSGQRTERVVWAVSADGKVLVNVSIDPDNPDKGVNVMIFDRQDSPGSASR
jgi:hypothetical protein